MRLAKHLPYPMSHMAIVPSIPAVWLSPHSASECQKRDEYPYRCSESRTLPALLISGRRGGDISNSHAVIALYHYLAYKARKKRGVGAKRTHTAGILSKSVSYVKWGIAWLIKSM
jgi:hypothetical protein